ncbi:MAG: glycosyltransferase [Deltaproteobacteria bacterium]|nr:glycosyltransferase [Deltaproteobacteria bacterium]MBW2359596.1 glycosyltransferase [Deltaproteobacteria bacterium]
MADEVRTAQPRVDVILPTHRGLPWVDEAIRSVLEQTYASLSLIVVDDASGDGTFAHVCERWSDDPRVTALALEVSQRAAGARMQALAASNAEWLAFVDQDDRWHPRKLELQLHHAALKPRADAVHTDCTHIDADGAPLPGSARRENAARARIHWDALEGEALARVCFRANRIRLGSSLVRRAAFEAAGGFDPALFGGEDWDFWVRFASAGRRIAHLPEPLLERRVHPQATSTARRAERIEGLYRACDLAAARDPFLAANLAQRLEALLRRELESGGGAAVRARLHERGESLAPGTRARLWLLSFAADLLPLGTQRQS